MHFFRKRLNRKGFTMIELMVVVVIVGVLAAIAIPIYGKYIKNARVTEATGRLGEVITACKAWAQEHQDASGTPQWPAATTSSFDYVDLSDSELFSYSITSSAGDADTSPLVVEADGRSGLKMDGVNISITVPDIYSNGQAPVVTGL